MQRLHALGKRVGRRRAERMGLEGSEADEW